MAEEKKITKKPVQKKSSTAKTPVRKKPVVKKATPVKKVVKKTKKQDRYIPELKKFYLNTVIKNMQDRFNYRSPMEVPKILKISLNMGLGDAKNNPKALESAVNELTLISGQKAVVTKSRRDISNFKVRKGFPVGCHVTLRNTMMFEFFHRLVSVALPRTRDFTGLSFKSFDRRGNYNFGIKEQIIFTEIDYDKIDSIRGLDVAITTSAKTDDEAYWLLKEFGFPLRTKPNKKDVEEAA